MNQSCILVQLISVGLLVKVLVLGFEIFEVLGLGFILVLQISIRNLLFGQQVVVF